MMQVTMPNTPETLSYTVLGSLGLNVVLALLLMGRGNWLGVVLVLAIAGGIYWFLCRHRFVVVSAVNAAAAGAVILLAAAITDLASYHPYFGILFLIAAICLGFVFILMRQGAVPAELRYGGVTAIDVTGPATHLAMLAALRDAGILTAEEYVVKVAMLGI
ncbi:MAG TPA: hypothetical protein VHW66_11320 [Stellaceae bacterium]|jgi:hypothetical protein|nr:hypothetical protein [Stellaceae bacterium]